MEHQLPFVGEVCARRVVVTVCLSAEVTGGQGVGFQQFRRGSLKADVPAETPRLGTDVHYVVRLPHHLLVMLDDNHAVAHVAQLLERINKPLVITLMQTNTRLIEDIQHIHQPAAHLRCQADTLTLAARQTVRRPRKRQVRQSHVQHKVQT